MKTTKITDMESNYGLTAQGNGLGYGAGYALAEGHDACGIAALQELGAVRRDIGESECGIKESILSQAIQTGQEFCATNKNISDNSRDLLEEILENRSEINKAQCDIEKEVMETKSELRGDIKDARFQLHENIRNVNQTVLQTKYDLAEKMDREFDQVRKNQWDFERSVDKQFCEVKELNHKSTQKILNQLTADKLDEKNDEIARLRAEKYHSDLAHNNQFVNYELAQLKSSINSIEQTQRFSSKVVQFGAGNLAGTAQTANQG